MAYFPGMAKNLLEEGAAVVISFATMANEVDKFRSRAILLVARRADIKYLNISMGEVALAFSSRIYIPSYEARVTRHRPEHVMVLFDYPPQRDMAVQAGILRVRGIHFDILPWTETQHGRDITRWYRVWVATENLLIHAWNPQVARCVLGDDCLFSTRSSTPHSGRTPLTSSSAGPGCGTWTSSTAPSG